MLASAFTGPITLNEKVDDWNHRTNLSGKTFITSAELEAYRAGTLSEDNPKFQVLTRLHNEAQENRRQLHEIHKEAEAYKDLFPVNDAELLPSSNNTSELDEPS